MYKAKPKRNMKQQMAYYALLGRVVGGNAGMSPRYSGKTFRNLRNHKKRTSGPKRKFHRQRR